jgi:LytS/YehU family sensor histidine kinase
LRGALAASLGTAIEARRAQIRAVQAQINPHFLFNSLNTVASLIHDAPELAESTVLRLASIFRHALERSRSDWTTLEAEFAFIEDAIAVERARFGVVEAAINLPDGLRGFRIPSMALHILVENAFKHGVSKAAPPKRIDVSAEQLDGSVRLRVADNGPGLEPAAQSAGRGLEILRELLARHYGDRASFRLERDEARRLTVAVLEIPA